MEAYRHRQPITRCTALMRDSDLDVLLLSKPANMTYLTGDGRLCAFAMITGEGVVALGVPVTDVADVSARAVFDLIVGFDDEVGMIHSIAHYFQELGLEQGSVGLENTFLNGAMRGVLTHPHAKPAAMEAKDCTEIMKQLRIVKDDDEVALIRAAGKVAAIGMAASVAAVRPGVSESEIAGEGELAMRRAGAEEFYRSYVSSGRRASIAHGLPTNATVRSGDLVMIDLHPVVDGYGADICRTACAGHAFFHGEAAPSPLAANTTIAIGNCGLYAGPWGIRVEDTVIVDAEGAEIVTEFRYGLTV